MVKGGGWARESSFGRALLEKPESLRNEHRRLFEGSSVELTIDQRRVVNAFLHSKKSIDQILGDGTNSAVVLYATALCAAANGRLNPKRARHEHHANFTAYLLPALSRTRQQYLMAITSSPFMTGPDVARAIGVAPDTLRAFSNKLLPELLGLSGFPKEFEVALKRRGEALLGAPLLTRKTSEGGFSKKEAAAFRLFFEQGLQHKKMAPYLGLGIRHAQALVLSARRKIRVFAAAEYGLELPKRRTS